MDENKNTPASVNQEFAKQIVEKAGLAANAENLALASTVVKEVESISTDEALFTSTVAKYQIDSSAMNQTTEALKKLDSDFQAQQASFEEATSKAMGKREANAGISAIAGLAAGIGALFISKKQINKRNEQKEEEEQQLTGFKKNGIIALISLASAAATYMAGFFVAAKPQQDKATQLAQNNQEYVTQKQGEAEGLAQQHQKQKYGVLVDIAGEMMLERFNQQKDIEKAKKAEEQKAATPTEAVPEEKTAIAEIIANKDTTKTAVENAIESKELANSAIKIG